ncbi:MAG TPA: hypothetical protein VGI82_10535 [Chitinophagaceae bacterium]|jgi:iron complex transport system ATP-binding protein
MLEKQRVHFARVLAQIGNINREEQKFLFLDEAVSHLDLKHQRQLLDIARNLCSHGVTVIAILHDINLALSYADHILFMRDGMIVHEIFSHGELTNAMIKDVFDIDVRIIQPAGETRPVVIY